MASTPDIPAPDRIDPQGSEQPGAHRWQLSPLDMALNPFGLWWTMLLDIGAFPTTTPRRHDGCHDLAIPEPIEQSGEKALFA